ncbi:hypothetical protein AB0M54_41250 [Actinoplanes sp. NPDC051470]|uniref:hypothetical protein n=1 Tax=unclassified Actinoplanes TaxID=2626549 RepID=UPI003417B87C
MSSQPRGDIGWDVVLAHRSPDIREQVRERFESSGVTAAQVWAVLADGGDKLFAAVASAPALAPASASAAAASAASASASDVAWAEPFGGPLAVALLAAEVGAVTAHLTSRSSAIRAAAVGALLDEYSAVTVARRLGVSRQKVYDIARPGTGTYIPRTPWSS